MQIIICNTTERLENITFVLERDSIEYIIPENNPLAVVLPNATLEDVDIINEDADCEEQRKRDNPYFALDIPVFSMRTALNHEKRDRLKVFYKNRLFRILDRDRVPYQIYNSQ